MSESKRRLLLGICLIGAVVYALSYYVPKLSGSGKRAPNTAQVTTVPSPQPTAMQTPPQVPQISLEEENAKPWGDDPFRSRKAPKVPTKAIGKVVPSWRLTGIVLGGNQPMAIINSKGVGEGDVVDGGRVISIESNKVILERDGQKYTLKVHKG